MLGQIANYCPVIPHDVIVKNSTSLEQILQSIRQHFGFQSSGAHNLYFSDIHLRSYESPEDLYQRLVAFMDDSLIKQEGGIPRHGVNHNEDEEMSVPNGGEPQCSDMATIDFSVTASTCE